MVWCELTMHDRASLPTLLSLCPSGYQEYSESKLATIQYQLSGPLQQ